MAASKPKSKSSATSIKSSFNSTSKSRILGRTNSASVKKEKEAAPPPGSSPDRKGKDRASALHWRGYAKELEAKHGFKGVEQVLSDHVDYVHRILRHFDLDEEYGPCVGISRMDRWKRADACGLNPPSEIKEILEEQQHEKKTDIGQTVFYGRVM